MNAYLADRVVRDHAETMMADAAAARQARRLRKQNRAARAAAKRGQSADASRQSADQPRETRPARQGAAAAHLIARPFTAARSWLVAGQM